MATLNLHDSTLGEADQTVSIPLASQHGASSSHPQPQIIYINTRPPTPSSSSTSPSFSYPVQKMPSSSSQSSTTSASSTLPEAKKEKGLIQTVLDSNPYFSAGFGLMAVGAGLTILRKGTVSGASVLRR